VSGDFGWNATVYARQVGSSEVFSFVNPTRTAETIGIDVLSAPATAAGGSWSGTWTGDDGSTTVAGIDARFAKGSMREAIAPARRGLGGGSEQDDSAIYVMRDQLLGPEIRFTMGGRISNWDDSERQLKQANITTKAILVDDEFPHVDGVEFSPEAGLIWRPSDSWSAHLNGQQAFSRPTLADLYGTTAQYSTVTEGNPELRTEYNTSLDVGTEYAFVTAEEKKKHAGGFSALRPPKAYLVVGASVFTNEMRDAIGALNLPGNALVVPATKALPIGYLAQQTANIDRSRIQGAAFTARWNPVSSLSFEARWQFSDPTILRDGAVPSLEHDQIAGVPRQAGFVGVEWNASKTVKFSARLRAFGAEYQDEENHLRLGESTVADAGMSFQLSAHAQLTVGVQNVGNARVQMNQNTDGIFYIGAPRTASAGIRLNW
jgi:outer membrane receptor protein involved in Fe transport